MNRLLQHRYVIRQNLIILIGVCLCIYFSYHILQGNRSAVRLLSLNSSIETLSLEYDSLEQQRMQIERRVVMMRPGSIDRDLLEERVRLTLGYRHADELAIVSN